MAADVSLNQLEKNVEFGPSQGRPTNDSEGIARTRRQRSSSEKWRSGTLPRVRLNLASDHCPNRTSLDSHLCRVDGYDGVENGAGGVHAKQFVREGQRPKG